MNSEVAVRVRLRFAEGPFCPFPFPVVAVMELSLHLLASAERRPATAFVSECPARPIPHGSSRSMTPDFFFHLLGTRQVCSCGAGMQARNAVLARGLARHQRDHRSLPRLLRFGRQRHRYIVMAYVVMAYVVMTYVVMAYVIVAYIVMAYVVMAYVVMTYVVMAYVIVAYIVMAYIVMAYPVMAILVCFVSAASGTGGCPAAASQRVLVCSGCRHCAGPTSNVTPTRTCGRLEFDGPTRIRRADSNTTGRLECDGPTRM